MGKIKLDNSDKGIFFVSKNPNKNVIGDITTTEGSINIVDPLKPKDEKPKDEKIKVNE